MAEAEEPNRLDEIEKKLYRRDALSGHLSRTELHGRFKNIKDGWGEPDLPADSNKNMSNSFLAKLLIFAIIFFIGTLAIAGFVIYRGSNQISGNNIDLDIKGPVAVRAGDETSLQIIIGNRNSTGLQNVKLIIEYPTDTKRASSTLENLAREIIDIGAVDSGEAVRKTVKAMYFGAEKEDKKVLAKLEYRVPGSNALYTKEADTHFTISAPPVNLAVNIPPEAPAGEEIKLAITLTPKAVDLSGPTLVTVDYPSGFDFISADIEPTFGDNIWLWEQMETGKDISFNIVGKINGLPNDRKSFKISAGSQDPIGEDTIDFVYNEVFKTVVLEEPFVVVSLKINGSDTNGQVVGGAEAVRVDIDWVNNLSTSVSDASIELVLNGEALDKARVTPGRGYYQTSRDIITWTKNNEPKLAIIEPSEKDSTSFSFYTKDLSAAALASVRDPMVNFSLILKGTRTSEGFAGEEIKTTVVKNIRLRSLVRFSDESLYRTGVIQNTGPLPPKVGSETTYTIVWSILNSSNTLRETVVKTILPPYVSWKNIKKPEAENITFNPTSRELVWDIGRLSPGSSARQVSFQVGVIPELSQVRKALSLTGPATLKAFDTFTETVIQEKTKGVDTNLSTEPGFSVLNSQVVQ